MTWRSRTSLLLYLWTQKQVSIWSILFFRWHDDVLTQYQFVIVLPAKIRSVRVVFMLIYNKPDNNTRKCLFEMEKLISALPPLQMKTGIENSDIIWFTADIHLMSNRCIYLFCLKDNCFSHYLMKWRKHHRDSVIIKLLLIISFRPVK